MLNDLSSLPHATLFCRTTSWVGPIIISTTQMMRGRVRTQFTCPWWPAFVPSHVPSLFYCPTDPKGGGMMGRSSKRGAFCSQSFSLSLMPPSSPLPASSFPLLEEGCRARFMDKEKLSNPLINFMGHVDMDKSDINTMSRARVL